MPQKELTITESSFIAFFEYSSVATTIEEQVKDLLNVEIFENSLPIYDTTFGQYGQDKVFLKKQFKTIQDIEDALKKHQEKIIEWGVKYLKNTENAQIIKGTVFKWLVDILKEKRISTNTKLLLIFSGFSF